jgi:flagellar FliL protein
MVNKLADDKKIPEQENASPSSSKNPLLIVLVAVNTIAVLGIGFFQFQNHKKLNAVTTAADVMQQQLAGEAGHGAEGAEAGGGEHGAPPAGGEHGEGGAAKATKADGLLYPIEPFTANLAQGDGPRRYIRISLVLKFTKETKKEEVDARKPQISDTIISMLNAKKPEELLKREGKEYLKEEIKTSINNFLVDGHLEEIYYVGFQIN